MRLIVYLLIVFLLVSCEHSKPNVDDIVKADTEFSNYAVKYGYTSAFIKYAHDSVVLLRDKAAPIVGKQALIRHFKALNDSGIFFHWKPVKAEIANSGELGYTYGTFEIVAEQDTSKGTYVSVWKKDKNGHWKYVLDSGNQGGVD